MKVKNIDNLEFHYIDALPTCTCLPKFMVQCPTVLELQQIIKILIV